MQGRFFTTLYCPLCRIYLNTTKGFRSIATLENHIWNQHHDLTLNLETVKQHILDSVVDASGYDPTPVLQETRKISDPDPTCCIKSGNRCVHLVFGDLEHSGMPKDGHGFVIDLCCFMVETGEAHSFLVKPPAGVPIQPAAFSKHHLTLGMLAAAPDLSTVMDQLKKHFHQVRHSPDDLFLILTHNAKSDVAILRTSLADVGYPMPAD